MCPCFSVTTVPFGGLRSVAIARHSARTYKSLANIYNYFTQNVNMRTLPPDF